MSHRKLLQKVVGVTLVMSFLVGCAAPATTPISEAWTATSISKPPAVTPTLEPPMVTPTPEPSALTLTPIPPTLTPTLVPPTPTLVSRPTPVGLKGRIVFYSPRAKGIRIMNADGTDMSDRPTDEWSSDPALSPDGSKIAFVMGNTDVGYDIYMMNADGTEIIQLTKSLGICQCPTWSPDGKRIAFIWGGIVATRHIGILQIIDADGSGTDTSIWVSLNRKYCRDSCAAWSPDGKRIAFSRICNDDLDWDIYLENVDGSEVVQLTDNYAANDYAPAWSPDGEYIAFVSDRDDPGHHYSATVYLMRADGSEAEKLPIEVGYVLDRLTWSPDGKYIAFGSDASRPQRAGLYVVSVDNLGLTRIGDGVDPSWSR